MYKKSILLVLFAALSGCDTPDAPVSENDPPEMNIVIDQKNNLLATLSDQDLKGFQWMNPPERFQFSNNTLKVSAGKTTDFFNNPENGDGTATAPLLYREVTGDFVATALVKPAFSAIWNAAALMIHADSTHWIKLAFENSDATGPSIVTVVTNGVSDDANGVILNDQEAVWLRLIRKGNIFALHWSADGKNFKMARLSLLPPAETVKVGMEAQCPVGEGATHAFLYFSLENKTVEDLRKGG